jgi:hypothetical protein
MLPTIRPVSPTEFDALFESEANIAEFSSKGEEIAYEKKTAFLTYLIRQRASEQFGPGDETCFLIDDWWPNHSRYVELAVSRFTLPFLTALHDLLADEFAKWRIQICVYGDTLEATLHGSTLRGSMVIYADRIVIEARLRDLVEGL